MTRQAGQRFTLQKSLPSESYRLFHHFPFVECWVPVASPSRIHVQSRRFIRLGLHHAESGRGPSDVHPPLDGPPSSERPSRTPSRAEEGRRIRRAEGCFSVRSIRGTILWVHHPTRLEVSNSCPPGQVLSDHPLTAGEAFERLPGAVHHLSPLQRSGVHHEDWGRPGEDREHVVSPDTPHLSMSPVSRSLKLLFYLFMTAQGCPSVGCVLFVQKIRLLAVGVEESWVQTGLVSSSTIVNTSNI